MRFVRHQTCKSEPLNTHLGLVTLDEYGYIVKLECMFRPKPGLERFVQEVPGFVDGELYPPEGFPGVPDSTVAKIAPPPPPPPTTPKPETTKSGPSDEEYWEVISELSQDEKNLNSAGYVDIDLLSKTLRERKMPVISGQKRTDITDAHKKSDEE